MKLEYVRNFNDSHDIPYPHDSKLWHIWLDICTVANNGKAVDVDKMMSIHGTDWSYYENDIDQLAEDGYLTRIYIKE